MWALPFASSLYQNSIRSTEKGCFVQVLVRDNNVDQALKALKKKMQREGIFREMKLRGHYEKPSEKKAREKAEAVRRARKLARKKLQREGLLPMKPKPVFGAGPGATVAVRQRRWWWRSARADRAERLPKSRFGKRGPRGPRFFWSVRDRHLRACYNFDRCILRRAGLPMRHERASIPLYVDFGFLFIAPAAARLSRWALAGRSRYPARRLLVRSGVVGRRTRKSRSRSAAEAD